MKSSRKKEESLTNKEKYLEDWRGDLERQKVQLAQHEGRRTAESLELKTKCDALQVDLEGLKKNSKRWE